MSTAPDQAAVTSVLADIADPETGLAFAYVMNQMEPGVLPNEKSLSLLEAVLAALQEQS